MTIDTREGEVRKTVNAFIPGAEPNMAAISNDAARRVTAEVRKRLGGLWVGGDVTLNAASLVFVPNAMNQRIHSNDCTWSLPLAAVTKVERRFGWVTGLIDIHAEGRSWTMRCFGAKSFANIVRARAAIVQT